jgi:hypothetical protein
MTKNDPSLTDNGTNLKLWIVVLVLFGLAVYGAVDLGADLRSAINGLATLNPAWDCMDVNLDTVVNSADQGIAASWFNKPNCPPYDCDINNDGRINSADMGIIAKAFGMNVQTIPACANKYPGKIVVTSVPSGALLSINDQFAGSAPQNFSRMPGSYKVDAYVDGYQMYTQTVNVVSLQSAYVNAILVATPNPCPGGCPNLCTTGGYAQTNGVCSTNGCTYTNTYCSYGCVNGACNPAPTFSCSDSDAQDEFSYGFINGTYNNAVFKTFDYCNGNSNSVIEMVCGPNYPSNVVKQCANGCLNGVCLTSGIPNSCSDSDGGTNLIVTGTASGYNGQYPFLNSDVCEGNIIREFYCSGVSVRNFTTSCYNPPNATSNGSGTTVCMNGACV